MVMRHNIGHNAASCLANALLMDIGLLDTSSALNPDKIAALKDRHGKMLEEKHLEENRDVIAAGADGKRSTVRENRGQSSVKDLQVLIDSARGTYLESFETPKGTGAAIAIGVFQVSFV